MFVLSSLVADIKSIVIGAVSHTAAIKLRYVQFKLKKNGYTIETNLITSYP